MSVAILNPTGHNALKAAERALARPELTDFARLSDAKKKCALARHWLICQVRSIEREGVTRGRSIDNVLARITAGQVSSLEQTLVDQLGARRLSRGTVYRWFSDLESGGVVALADGRCGRQADRPYLTLLMQLVGQPPRRSITDYTEKLRAAGFEVTARQVGHTLQKLPTHLTSTGNAQLGPHHRQQNFTPYTRRNRRDVPPGVYWEGDGHLLDWYTRHHNNGKPHRYEYTQLTDVGSDVVVGWWLSDAESGSSTYFSLCHAILSHDHVPGLLHVDPGPGFKSGMIVDKVKGLCAISGMEMEFARSGNARGKGLTEGSFRWLEAKVGKDFGMAYCGHDMPAEFIRTQPQRMDKGDIQVPTLAETVAAINAYHQKRLHLPCPALDPSLTRLELWNSRTRNPLHLPPDMLLRPTEVCTVRNFTIRLFKRDYKHSELNGWHRRDVLVAYNIHDHRSVTVRTLDGQWICEALLIEAVPGLSESRLQDLEQKRLDNKAKRRALRQAEDEEKARRPIESWSVAPPALETYRMPGVPMLAVDVQRASNVIDGVARNVSPDALAAVTAAIESEQAEPVRETAAQRFARWQALDACKESLTDAERAWHAGYPHTSEFRAQQFMAEEFAEPEQCFNPRPMD